jgi:hypothetical protein
MVQSGHRINEAPITTGRKEIVADLTNNYGTGTDQGNGALQRQGPHRAVWPYPITRCPTVFKLLGLFGPHRGQDDR